MNKSTKFSLVASAILSLSVFAACVPVAVEVPPSTNATSTPTANPSVSTAPTTVPTDSTAVATPTPVSSTGTSTPTTPPTTSTVAPTAVATASTVPSPTGTATTLTNESGSGGSGGSGGTVASASPNVTGITRTAGGIAGVFGDSITVTGNNLSGGSGTIKFYMGPNYQQSPALSIDKSITLTVNAAGNSATATIPTLTDAEVNTLLGRATGTAVSDTDRQNIIANVLVATSGGSAQSGAIGAGGL